MRTPGGDFAVLFCDGACLGNPGPGGWGAVYRCDGDVKEMGGKDLETTNNRMELAAALEGLKALQGKSKAVRIYTDSQYLVRGMTEWLQSWKRKSWKSSINKGDVKNQDLWKALDQVAASFSQLEWRHVDGHSGIPGNERCDEIAVEFAKGNRPQLFYGKASEYAISLEVIPKAKSRKIEPYYLSLIHGKTFKDKTWKECESRVRGQAGARYKKISNLQEEEEILKKWGISS